MTKIICKKCGRIITEKCDSKDVKLFDVCIECTTLLITVDRKVK